MRIIINVRQVGTKMEIVPKLDQNSKDNINEINAGHMLFTNLAQVFTDMQAAQSNPPKLGVWGKVKAFLRGKPRKTTCGAPARNEAP